MKRRNPQLTYRSNGRVPVNALRCAPFVKLVAAVLIAAAVCGAAIVGGRAVARRVLRAQGKEALSPQAITPVPSEAPSPAVLGPVGRVALPDGIGVLADASVSGDTVLFAAGKTGDKLDCIVRVNALTGQTETLFVPLANDSLRFPAESGNGIAYVDAFASGGGAVMLLDRLSGAAEHISTVAADIPKLSYEAPYLVWQMRTAAHIEKLVAFDTRTRAAVTLAVFGDTAGARSEPSLKSGLVLYADAAAETPEDGQISALQLADGSGWRYAAGMAAHDPKSYGRVWAWLSDSHGADGALYFAKDGGAAVCAARGVVDFGMTAEGPVYGLDEAVYLYRMTNGETVRLSEIGTRAQFAAAGDALAVWRDMTDAAHPVWKYMRFD